MGFIENKIVYKTNEGDKQLDQVVTFKEGSFQTVDNDDILFSFVGEFGEGDSISAHEILNIEKGADNSYYVRIKMGDIFKNADGKTIESLGLEKRGDDFILNIDPSSPAISMRNKGEELFVEVRSSDGKVYKIIAGATDISFEYGEDKFAYSTEGKSAIASNLNECVIEEFLDSSKKVCKTPEKLSEFPNYLIGLFSESLEKNSTVTYGDYTITKIDLTEEGADPLPYLFITKADPSTSKKSSYIYINGKFQKCDNFICQYEKDDDGNITSPSIVLEVAPLRKTKTSTMKYYSIPLSQTGATLDDASQTALELIHDIAHDGSSGHEEISLSTGSGEQKFFVKDTREYAKDYKFNIKPIKITRDGRTDEEEAEDDSEKNLDTVPPVTGGGNDGSGSGNEQNDSGNGGQGGGDKDDDKKKEKDLSKPAELFGEVSGIVGLFLMAGAMITPFGAVLAPIGLSLALGGTFGTAIADQLKFKPFKKAKKKVEEMEKREAEDRTFSSHFIENENEVTRCEELSAVEEAELLAMLDEPTNPISTFGAIYDQYGIGFSVDLEGSELARTDMFCGYEGLALRQSMASDLRAISETRSASQRSQLIDTFMFTHFRSMPKAEEERVRELFSTENQPAMTAFRKKIESLNTAHTEQQTAIRAQIASLEMVEDGILERIVSSPKMDQAQRERFFRRYSPAIIKRYASDKHMNEAKLAHLIAVIPAEDRKACSKILGETAKRIDKKLDTTRELARVEARTVAGLEDCRKYATVLSDTEKEPTAFASYTDVVKESRKFLLTHDMAFFNKAGFVKGASQIQTQPAEVTSLGTEAKAVCDLMNGVATTIATPNEEIKNAWKAIFAKMEERKTEVKEGETITHDSEIDTIAKSYIYGSPISLYPSKGATSTSYKKTLAEIAKTLGKTDGELSAIVARFEEAKVELLKGYQTTQIPAMLEKITAELATYDIEVSEDDVEKMETSLASKAGNFGEGNRKSLAQIKVQLATQIATLKKAKDPSVQQQLAHLIKVQKFVDKIVSGDLATAQIHASIMSAITEIDSEITPDAELAEEGKKLKTALAGEKHTRAMVDGFSQQDDRKAIKKKMQEKTEAGMGASEALAETLKEVLSDRQYEELALSYDEFIAKYTKEGKLDLTGLSKELSTITAGVKARPKAEIASMSPDLDEDIATARYEEQRESGEKEKPSYDSTFELIVAMAEEKGLSREDVMKALQENKSKIGKTLKALGINEKEFDKKLGEVELEGFSETAIIKAEKVKKESEACRQATEDFEVAWNTALASGDTATLKTLLESDKVDKILCDIGIDRNDILAIITKGGMTPEKIKEELASFNKGNLVFKKLAKVQREREIEAKRAEMISTLPTKEGREFAESQFALATLDSAILEFQAKLDAIAGLTAKGYDEALVSDAMKAFADGDEAFFITHPEIQLPAPYFFSSQDEKLFKMLKVSAKKLKGKNREKAMREISKAIGEKRRTAVTAIENMKAKMATQKQAKKAKANGKFAKLFKKRVHLTSRVMEEVNQDMEIHSPTAEVSPQERLADAGLIYEDDLTLENL